MKFYCINCKEKIIGRSKKYCSNKCQQEYQKKEKITLWLSGNPLQNSYHHELSKTIRDYLLQRANYSCSICGWNKINPFTELVPLQIHHIDGDYKNNRPENLQVLCPNCHSLTETFGALNKKGFGRRLNGDM